MNTQTISIVLAIGAILLILVLIIKNSKKKDNIEILEETPKKEKNKIKEIPINKTDQISDPAMIRMNLEEEKEQKEEELI